MNMPNAFQPFAEQAGQRRGVPRERLGSWLRRRRMFLGMVAVPLLLLAGYLFLFASDQYESEAHFLVRTTDSPTATAGGVSQVLNFAGLGAAQSEAMSVADYLTSHDVVDTLRRDDRLVERFRRPGIDLTSRLWSDDPTPERLLGYYRRQVGVEYSSETGITTLKVRSFVPQDSFDLIRKLLLLGEQRVNMLNRRSYSDMIVNAQQQLAEAEDQLALTQRRLASFRKSADDIDPQASGEAQLTLVTQLSQQLAAARAQLTAMRGLINPASPQYRAMAARVAGLEAQVAAQSGRLVSGRSAIANDIGGYEDLRLRQQFANKRYEAAAANLQKSRDQFAKQQLYIVRVVDANMPVKSLYPQRWRIMLTAAAGLLLAYAITWLIIAGVREHAA